MNAPKPSISFQLVEEKIPIAGTDYYKYVLTPSWESVIQNDVAQVGDPVVYFQCGLICSSDSNFLHDILFQFPYHTFLMHYAEFGSKWLSGQFKLVASSFAGHNTDGFIIPWLRPIGESADGEGIFLVDYLPNGVPGYLAPGIDMTGAFGFF